jgi:hypothetical protein
MMRDELNRGRFSGYTQAGCWSHEMECTGMRISTRTGWHQWANATGTECFFERHKFFAFATSFGVGLLACLVLANNGGNDVHGKVISFEELGRDVSPSAATVIDWPTWPGERDERPRGSNPANPAGARQSIAQPGFFSLLHQGGNFDPAWKDLTEHGVRLQS